ncbi:hypothetical protein T4E_1935 [Trichinella pseudospiralis]|uniref:Uncharacterized protein n=1 Tax=Trichinella pseudospiralis TaxID=6337 RepID=A0A0V0YJZ5_TRIPS|nr:hypothetical protein T4E_1935 [Trichinella pseudospiralis]
MCLMNNSKGIDIWLEIGAGVPAQHLGYRSQIQCKARSGWFFRRVTQPGTARSYVKIRQLTWQKVPDPCFRRSRPTAVERRGLDYREFGPRCGGQLADRRTVRSGL